MNDSKHCSEFCSKADKSDCSINWPSSICLLSRNFGNWESRKLVHFDQSLIPSQIYCCPPSCWKPILALQPVSVSVAIFIQFHVPFAIVVHRSPYSTLQKWKVNLHTSTPNPLKQGKIRLVASKRVCPNMDRDWTCYVVAWREPNRKTRSSYVALSDLHCFDELWRSTVWHELGTYVLTRNESCIWA